MRGRARHRVTWSVSALTLLGAAMLAPPAQARALSAAVHPDAPFTLSISGIDRDGTAVSVPASVYSQSGESFLSGGNSVSVPAGNYVVAAPIWRPADGSTQTLVASEVHVSGDTNVTLDAQGAVPMAASLIAPGTTAGPQTVELCLAAGGDVNAVAGFLVQTPGTVFVQPMTGKGLRTVYQTFWQGPGTLYDVAEAFSGGIPTGMFVHANPAAMAKVHVQLRAEENVTPLRAVLATYDKCGTTTEPVTSLPAGYTDFRTPGEWSTDLNFGPKPSKIQRDLFKDAVYKGAHQYSDIFDSAAAGPGAVFPVIDGSTIEYSPGNLFSDPVVRVSFDCEGRASIRLSRSATTVKKSNLTFCGKTTVFSAHVIKKTFYDLNVNGQRFNPSGKVPAGALLSPKVSLNWRFPFAPVRHHLINVQAAPVTVTRFVPQGLSFHNDSPGGTTTQVRCFVLRGGGEPVATPRYRLKRVAFQASFNDGANWHPLAATLHGSFWVVKVHNPPSGFVSLRSIVTDVHGDSTTETILRAYLTPAG
ncbi:MAG TPA: hypothetical protein VFQ44_28265 [Streptosporangiaceae bacterium]|nr:hypothetical protein [Streptosporangiaceae bacterium]